MLRSQGAAGRTVRRVLPFAILVPVVSGWVSMLGVRQGLYELPVGIAFVSLTSGVALGAIVSWTAASLLRIDRARARAEGSLQQSEERFRCVAESLPEVVSVVGKDGTIEFLNPYYFELTGLAPAEVEGEGWVSVLHPEDAARSLNAWKEAQATGKGYELDQRIRRRDGVYRWHHVRVLPVVDAAGAIAKWVSTATDIDDRRRMGLSLQSHSDELARSNRELESFAYISSHDLQEPLRTLCGFSELLLERHQGKLDGESRELLQAIRARALRMHELIQSLLAYSRVQTRGETFQRVRCAELLQQAVAELAVPLAEAGAQVTYDPLPEVWGDQRQLGQLFRGLLSNALHHRRPEVPPSIHFSAEREDRAWRFSVRDNGTGFEQCDQDRVFELFYRSPTGEGAEPSGLGLTISRRIVERHGGRIWFDSHSGSGTTFHFNLEIPEESAG